MTVLSDRPDERRAWRRAWPHLSGHRAALCVVALLNLIAAGARVGGFVLLGVVTDGVLARDRERVVWAVGAYLVLGIAGMALSWAGRYLVIRVGESFVARLRERAVAAIANAPLRFLEDNRHGELLRRLTGEVAELSMFVGSTLPGLLASVVLVGITVVVLAGYSWLLTAVLVVLAFLVALVLGRGFLARATSSYSERASAEAQVSATFSESLPAREEIAVLGAQARRSTVLAATEERLLRARIGELRTEFWLLALGPAGGLVLVVLLALASLGVAAGWLAVGGAVVFVLAARAAWGDMEDLVIELGDLRAARTSMARVLDLLDSVGGAHCRQAGAEELPSAGDLTAAGAGFRYPSSVEPALTAVNLRIGTGERVALVGATGSGKTTLGKLLAGLYEPTDGVVSFAGVDLANADPDSIRRRIAVVPQGVVLVAGTIADNLAMRHGGPAVNEREEVLVTARSLGLEQWLNSLPDGLDTEVGEHGQRLSAGERQLVALWRAALGRPAVLVLDEATSDVDPTMANQVEDALAHAATGRTVVMIAHRDDTVARTDRVIRLDLGRQVSRRHTNRLL